MCLLLFLETQQVSSSRELLIDADTKVTITLKARNGKSSEERMIA